MGKISDNDLKDIVGGFSDKEIEWAKQLAEIPYLKILEGEYICSGCGIPCADYTSIDKLGCCSECACKAKRILEQSGIKEWKKQINLFDET